MRVVILGINGAMGSYIADVLEMRENIELLGGIDKANKFIKHKIVDFNIDFDLLIDFSNKECINYLYEALKRGIKVISGTTGFSDYELMELKKLASDMKTSIIYTPNFSKGASYLYKMSRALKNSFNVDALIETHKKEKKDIPSGTAKQIAKAINYKEEDIQSLRINNVVARHEIIFNSSGEKITITHEVFSKSAFIVSFLNCLDLLIERDNLISIGLKDYYDLIKYNC